MPGPTIQEQDVSNYWVQNYDPVNDFAYSGSYGIQTSSGVVHGTMVGMTDGSIWFDHDNDGWFDVGRRLDANGDVEEYDGRWRRLENDADQMPTDEPQGFNLGMTETSYSSDWFL